MDSKLRITTLAASEAAGSDRIFLCSGAEVVHHVTLQPGTAHQETVRVWDFFGTGPYVARLGYDKDHPTYLRSAHPTGSAVRIEAVSTEVVAARQKAAFGLCMHPEAVPVRTLDDEEAVVAWLCPQCDEMLPADWELM